MTRLIEFIDRTDLVEGHRGQYPLCFLFHKRVEGNCRFEAGSCVYAEWWIAQQAFLMKGLIHLQKIMLLECNDFGVWSQLDHMGIFVQPAPMEN